MSYLVNTVSAILHKILSFLCLHLSIFRPVFPSQESNQFSKGEYSSLSFSQNSKISFYISSKYLFERLKAIFFFTFPCQTFSHLLIIFFQKYPHPKEVLNVKVIILNSIAFFKSSIATWSQISFVCPSLCHFLR